MAPDCTFSQEHIELLGIISEGRMFRIHKARRGTKYIILKSAVRNDAMTTEFLRREYELGSTLSHSCIVTTLGFEEDTPAGPALILEYVEGQSLDEFLSAGPSDSAKDCIIDDILDGVDYLHHRGVLHNDIKPSNIVINPHGAARIIDFGLSISDDSVYKGCMGGSQGYSVTESSHNALKDRLRTEMSVFYIPARDSMFCQQTYYDASVFKCEYLLRFVHFRDSLPADQRLACEEIFAEQSAVLDSILFSLQSAVRDSILLSLPGRQPEKSSTTLELFRNSMK